jgi:hypothetical protein
MKVVSREKSKEEMLIEIAREKVEVLRGRIGNGQTVKGLERILCYTAMKERMIDCGEWKLGIKQSCGSECWE